MSSVYFEQFESLWQRVKDKFVSESNGDFTLDNLCSSLISQNLLNSQNDLKSIEAKFLKHIDLLDKPRDVNLSDTIFKALFKYVGIQGISELKVNIYPPTIGFLGRRKEISELEDFLQSPEKCIFALYGLRMIGKTKLVNYFLEKSEAKTYQIIPVKLNPSPDNAEQRIKDEVFGDKDFNDFSDFSSNTIIVIQDFEEALNWTGDYKNLHDIKNEYPNIKRFLEEAAKKNTVKIILESRFQIHFEVVLGDLKAKAKTLFLQAIEEKEFWRFYEYKGFSYKQFKQLCKNFDNHTGLLALAYNDAEFLFQNKLIEAYYQPTLTTRILWDLIEHMVNRLENREIWILCALTFLQKPVKKEDLYEDFRRLPDFQENGQIDHSFVSLCNKLLVQLERGHYDLNPYIREVCYTFLKDNRRTQMRKIGELPYFEEHGKAPFYDKIRQAQEKSEFREFFRLIKEKRSEKKYKEVHSHLESALHDPQFKKVIVFNEIAITYKVEGKLNKAIETLEFARQKYSRDVKTLDELGICYRKNNQLDKAIEALETARGIKPNNHQTLNELVICYQKVENYVDSIKIAKKLIELEDYIGYTILATTYQKMGEIETAYHYAEEGMKTSGWDKSRLTEKFYELEELLNQQKNEPVKKLKVFLSYSRKDEDIKEDLDKQLSALRRSDKISTWNDREIPAGTEWDSRIKQELDDANIILLLVSADFIASEYIWETELKKAIEKDEKGDAVVIPIFCRACDFSDMPFAKLKGLPKNFITSYQNQDEALTEVAKGIRKVVDDLLG